MNDSEYQKKIAEIMALLHGIRIDEGLFIITNVANVILADTANHLGHEHSREIMNNVITAIKATHEQYMEQKKKEFSHAS